jgi:hypothetical protein
MDRTYVVTGAASSIGAAAALAWCVSAENSMMTGQVLFVEGGAECLARGGRSS